MKKIMISGFADEISDDFKAQLMTVKQLGMRYISLRSAHAKNIADYTVDTFRADVWPLLQDYGIQVSSLGSPIGKVRIDNAEGIEEQRKQLVELCRIANLLGTKYIRIFSFYPPEGRDIALYREQIIAELGLFIAIAEQHDIVLVHENEKDIYGDTLARCEDLMQTLYGPHFAAVFDFANFVQCDQDPVACWEALKDYVRYFHIKDARYADHEVVLFGSGDGQVREVLKRALVHPGGYEGFLTMEPHLFRFNGLDSLENKPVEAVIKENKVSSQADGFVATYRALNAILKELGL